MSKDPAFLFYSSDFLTGVSDLTLDERGQYITLLCLQHQKGHLSDKVIKIAVGVVSPDVLAKFQQDDEGLHFNPRLEVEAFKRSEHSRKQKERALKGWEKRKGKSHEHTTADAAALPLEDENENVNTSIIDIKKVVEYLNTRLNTKYKHNSKATSDPIRARLNEGYTVEDFKIVIDKKAEEWEHDKDFSKFLRPSTLFSPKFEGYLNQKEATESREEELNIHLLQHLQDVRTGKHVDVVTDDNRVRRISTK